MTIDLSVTSILLYCACGIFAGVLSSMFGVGSGIVMIPMFTLVFSFTQKDAQGMSLAIMVPMALMGAIRYHLNPESHMDWRVIGIFALFVIIGANLGATIAHSMTNRALQISFACLLIIVGIHTIFKTLNGGE